MIAFGVVRTTTIYMVMVLYDNGRDNLWGGQDNDYLYGGPNADSGDAGPGADLRDKIEIENNCGDRYDD